MIISSHIPKAAGSSLLEYWVDIFGPEAVCTDYHGAPVRVSDIQIPLDRNLKRRVKNILASNSLTRPILNLIREKRVQMNAIDVLHDPKIKVIHGHFPFAKYSNIFPDADTVILFRDPWKRLISNYIYWRDNYNLIRTSLPDWFSPETTFQTFAEHPSMQNVQARYLDGKTLQGVTHFGVLENFKPFIQALYTDYSDHQAPEVEFHRNCGTKADLNLDENELRRLQLEFLDRNKIDLQLFNSAREGKVEIQSEVRVERVLA